MKLPGGKRGGVNPYQDEPLALLEAVEGVEDASSEGKGGRRLKLPQRIRPRPCRGVETGSKRLTFHDLTKPAIHIASARYIIAACSQAYGKNRRKGNRATS